MHGKLQPTVNSKALGAVTYSIALTRIRDKKTRSGKLHTHKQKEYMGQISAYNRGWSSRFVSAQKQFRANLFTPNFASESACSFNSPGT